ncbi:disease resistance protein Aig2 [Penicillium hispanicum]|uniref:disease resistance protein Aig2 n=1 Tax=Penicillium hispanicum TaxID=1080232 RepID=UPI0025421BD8|nr:disease resistance protein Aig2 [Penicillium hispanicum]KAJ5573759.1 disease resistance protein Aig2 [Penicillium hispanicum]
MGDHVLFFYGTLMAPQILHRVIHGRPEPEHWQKAMLRFQPAVLHGYRRHRVRNADYPGIVPVSKDASSSTTESESTRSSSNTSVLGTLVSGLTDGDVHRLDIYEGSEYAREHVKVRTLQESLHEGGKIASSTDGHLRDVLEAAGSEFADEADEVDAVTYVWISDKEDLEEAEWDFETFKRDKMPWWVEADESEW